jgi:formiminotetrahydrofolate cyclodeaminase
LEMTGIENLLREISSGSPAPGGGSVAALSGCFGSALVSMVCKLSLGKKKYKEIENELKEVLSEAEALRKELLKLSKEDIEAFNEVIAALKMSDEKEKKKGIQTAYKRAADVPFKVSKKCLRVMELAEFTTSKGNQNAFTDSAVAALMAYSGLKGAVLNVKVNLKHIDDENFKSDMRNKIVSLEKSAEKVFKAIIGVVESSFSS